MSKVKMDKRHKRKIRIRKRISGTAGKPRLAVFRSLNNIYAQVIDDAAGKTLVAASTLSKEIENEVKSAESKVAKSKIVGTLLAKKALENSISTVVFDRSGYLYHGRVKAVAEGAREGGLKI